MSFLGYWILVSIYLKVINYFIIWHILYVDFILKISFHHDVFFGLAWCRTLKCHIHRAFPRARWIHVLSKYVTRDAIQLEKNIIWIHLIIVLIHLVIVLSFLRLPLLASSNISHIWLGPSWSWSYSSWIYNCLCNQCLSPLNLWFRISLMTRCTRYNIIQLLTFIEVNIRIYRSKKYYIYREAEVNIVYLGTIYPYINRNESQ
jgi:hypothetical protein